MLKLGLIGHPVGHSMSPWIHHQLMEQQGLTGSYELFDISPEQFDTKIEQLKSEGLDGFNVTVPHKERIIPHLDRLDESAKALGAVNTVKCTPEGWVGYNTDGTGFVDSLRNRFPEALQEQSSVLLLGSGGAARGIYFALLQTGVKRVDIANRTIARAEAIIDSGGGRVASSSLDLDQAEAELGHYDVVIQTTTVGMSPNSDEHIVSADRITKGTVVSDIVYRPMKTKFLEEAEKQGAALHFGHEMLLQQAVYAFKIWTRTNPDALAILDRFESKLKGV
ncbi:shikimate dehydrogenase [Halobacillus litoralis]|uniref:shikimate dehydrogenase n=1 Tax=Halobacillus litoralis TaxID=45668 RepID=UPI001CD7498A|nr:shikimate dehydrogenase [Halobacillus litoralis]MCA0970007.1 shikimate dehydrogenase [Halobacillus litoralis]